VDAQVFWHRPPKLQVGYVFQFSMIVVHFERKVEVGFVPFTGHSKRFKYQKHFWLPEHHHWYGAVVLAPNQVLH